MSDQISEDNEIKSEVCNACGSCKHFERLRFHKSICADEAFQRGGMCKALKSVLEISNSNLWVMESIHVYESFGCNLHAKLD